MLNLSLRCVLLCVLLAGQSIRADEKKVRTDLQGDPLPDGALVRLGSARLRHGDSVSFTAFLPGGKLLLSVGADGTIRVWDLANGKAVRGFLHDEDADLGPIRRGRRGSAIHASLSADGKLLATALMNGRRTRLWDVTTGKELRQISATAYTISSAALSPDGKMLAINATDGKVRLHETATGKEIRGLGEVDPQGGVRFFGGMAAMRFSPDGKLLVIAGVEIDNGMIKRGLKGWEVAGGKLLYRVESDVSQGINNSAVTFSPDGKLMAWSTFNTGIHLADAATGKELKKIQPTIARAEGVVFSPDGKTIFAQGIIDGVIGIWDVASGKEVKMIGKPLGPQQPIRPRSSFGMSSGMLSLSADGKIAASAEGNLIRLVDLTTGKDILPSGGHRGPIFGLQHTPDGKTLISQSLDGTIRRWEVASGKETGQVRIPAAAYSFLLSPDGKLLLTEGADGSVRLWDAATSKERCQIEVAERTRLSRYAFSPDGKLLAMRGRIDPLTRLYSVETGKLLATLGKADPMDQPRRFFARSLALAFSPDSKLLATTGAEGGVTIWEVRGGHAWREISLAQETVVNPTQVRDLAFSPDGRSLAVDLHGNSVCVYEVATGGERRHYRSKSEEKNQLAFGGVIVSAANAYHGTTLTWSLDGRRLALAGDKRVVQVWDTTTGEQIGNLAGHQGEVAALVFSPDGKTLASAGEDATGLIWDAAALKGGKKLPDRIQEAVFEKSWADLQSTEPARAFDAICSLSAAPGSVVSLLDRKMKPAVPAEAGKIEKLIADLDARRFPTRKKALEELERLGAITTPALKSALERKPSEEMRKRIEELLEKARGQSLSPAQLQFVRAIEVLERAGTTEARALLEKLARGAPGALETSEGRSALNRLR